MFRDDVTPVLFEERRDAIYTRQVNTRDFPGLRYLRLRAAVGLLLLALAVNAELSGAQLESSAKRRIVSRSAAAYPALARSMALQGLVKLEALVAADGSVKTVEIKGGHPVLAQAAVNTVRTWKWESAAHESRETIEIRFSPPE